MDQAALQAKAGVFRESLIADQAIVTAGQARMVNTIAECAECGAWQADGAGDLTSWVMATLNVAYPAAADLVGLARRLVDLPELAKSFAEGRVPLESAGAAAKLASPETDAFFAEVAETSPAKDLIRAVKHQESLENQRANPAPRPALHWSPAADGWYRFTGFLPPEEGAKLVAALERAARQDDQPDPLTKQWDPAETKAAKALVALASTELEADGDPDRATVVVHVGLKELISGEGAATLGTGMLGDGGVILASLAQRLACDARIEVVVEDNGRVRAVSTADRRIPPWLLRQLHHRDRHCQFPACGRTRHLHAHHRQHFAKGGPTNLNNLILMCTVHHRLMHEGGWNAVGDAEPGPGGRSSIVFTRPDGSVYVPHPSVVMRSPEGHGPAPEGSGPAPQDCGPPLSEDCGPPLSEDGRAPADGGPAPEGSGPAPEDCGPPLTEDCGPPSAQDAGPPEGSGPAPEDCGPPLTEDCGPPSAQDAGPPEGSGPAPEDCGPPPDDEWPEPLF